MDDHQRTPVRALLMDGLPVPIDRLGVLATPVIAFAVLIWTLEKLNQHVLPALARARYVPSAVNRMFRRWAHRVVEEEAALAREGDRDRKIDRLLSRADEMATQLRPNGGTETTVHDVIDRIESRLNELTGTLAALQPKVGKACDEIAILLHEREDHDRMHDAMQDEAEQADKLLRGLLLNRFEIRPDEPGGET